MLLVWEGRDCGRLPERLKPKVSCVWDSRRSEETMGQFADFTAKRWCAPGGTEAGAGMCCVCDGRDVLGVLLNVAAEPSLVHHGGHEGDGTC